MNRHLTRRHLFRATAASIGALALARTAGAAEPAAAQTDDWPQFRGPTGMGTSTAKKIPTQWSPTQNIAWKTPLPGQGWSSPVVAGGKIYLTAAVKGQGDKVSLGAACLDAATGKILWDQTIFEPTPQQSSVMHRKNTLASATPLLSGDRLFVHFGHMGTAALDLTGKIHWRQTELGYSPTHGNGSSPILAGGGIVFSADAERDPFLASLDPATGKVKWKTPRRGGAAKRKFSFATPLLIDAGGQPQIISPASGYVGAYDPATGDEIWRVEYGQGYSVVPRPVYAHGLIFVASGFDQATLYAIKVAGAQGNVTASHVAWKIAKGAPLTPSVIVVGDELYMVADNGMATCADARTGKIHWTKRLDGNFSASPVAAEGRIYFQNESGVGSVIKASKTFEPVAENDLQERTLSSYAVIEGGLLIRTESSLIRVKA